MMGKYPGLYGVSFIVMAIGTYFLDGHLAMTALGLVLGGMGIGAEVERRS